jgi:(1->4)-alpha-D-glucan 1-alpha-D-glucosylmutase
VTVPLRATYRLQLGPELGFAEVCELVPYLSRLGISHLYLSPVFQARSGSTHGYDVVDPTRISDDLGGMDGFRRLAETAGAAGLGIVLDVVPNHMAVDDANPFWADPEQRRKVFDLDPETGSHRRFFDIGELAGVRVEDDEVFSWTHRTVLELVEAGLVDGLRIDHIDGLADPAGYLRRLAAEGVRHVWVEKIVEPGEELRNWPVEGTTGYEFLNEAGKLFVDPTGAHALSELYAELTSTRRDWSQVAVEGKLECALTTFQPEVEWLRRELAEPFPELERALASFHVYRTYVEPWSGRVEDADRDAVAAAELPERLARILLLEEPGHDSFVTRFQQTTGPVMAKGIEDTAFYRYLRLVSLNEVGGDPSALSLPADEFHEANRRRQERFPRTLLTSTTHDTKRTADVRARIAALAGMAQEWRARVYQWRLLNEPLRSELGAPDANEEYLIYQTLVGAWPLEPERLIAYMEKAMREAKVNTSWIEPNDLYEAGVKVFCLGLYEHKAFLNDFGRFTHRVLYEGERAALGQLLLKLTSPGVPDVYQGDELWFLALVDPDNRRPVDWDERRRLLAELKSGAEPRQETMKLFVLTRALDLRARLPYAFADTYEPVEAGASVCAFVRGDEVLVAVPLGSGWQESTLEDVPAGTWRDVFTGEERDLDGPVRAASLFERYPFALLERVHTSLQ